MRGFAVVVKLQGDADDVVALLLEQRRDDARIDAARHRDHDAGFARRLGWLESVEGGKTGRHIRKTDRFTRDGTRRL